jgi:glycosyltransferase involved in cell wall biosynthesis
MMIVGIDASRNRSGGAKAHIIGILRDGNPAEHGIKEVHLWSYKSLLDSIEDYPWLIKHNPPQLEKSLLHQLRWQYFSLPHELRKNGCEVVLNTDAGSICNFRPGIVMSRDMLSYEKGEMERFGYSFQRLRLLILKYVQSRSIRNAEGVIFLTNYAAKIIGKHAKRVKDYRVIPHGVGEVFKRVNRNGEWQKTPGDVIRCLYVSNVELYKHQATVAKAFELLKSKGHNVHLVLAGGGHGVARQQLEKQLASMKGSADYIEQIEFVPHDKIPDLLKAADLFIFASSCENMPNTLLEAMSSGLPIACSDRGPMPEVLQDGGVYFDPEDEHSISTAVEQLIINSTLRKTVADRGKTLANQYSWQRCARETWEYIYYISNKESKKQTS